MIKFGFKLFGCLTVVIFIAVAGVYIAVETVPPVYKVRKEITDIIYPTAREHLVRKFGDFIDEIPRAKKKHEFKISEIEANAYIYYLLNDRLTIQGVPFVQDPYLFVKPGLLKLRIDIPAENLWQLIKNGMGKKDFDENLKSLVQAHKTDFTFAITILIRCYWVKDHPYFYIERVYVGVMPLPVSIFFAEYQDQANEGLWKFYQDYFKHLPFEVTKITVRDKEIRIAAETKVTDVVALQRENLNFQKNNPILYGALLSKKCLYGCTKEERAAMKKFYGEMTGFGAADIEMSKLVEAQMMLAVMRKRESKSRENKIKKMLTPQGAPDMIIYPDQ